MTQRPQSRWMKALLSTSADAFCAMPWKRGAGRVRAGRP
jgi:hypothetical protein